MKQVYQRDPATNERVLVPITSFLVDVTQYTFDNGTGQVYRYSVGSLLPGGDEGYVNRWDVNNNAPAGRVQWSTTKPADQAALESLTYS